jgi:hypothetical protein
LKKSTHKSTIQELRLRNHCGIRNHLPRLSEAKTGGSGGARTRDKFNNDAAKIEAPSQTASQRSVTAGHDLSKVVTAWEKLPAPLKAAILAIVKSAE